MPLCMGIAIASGVPPEKGLITGIIGGLVVGLLAGSPLQVSGPAAGLAVIVFELVRDQGLSALGPILVLAGADPVRRRHLQARRLVPRDLARGRPRHARRHRRADRGRPVPRAVRRQAAVERPRQSRRHARPRCSACRRPTSPATELALVHRPAHHRADARLGEAPPGVAEAGARRAASAWSAATLVAVARSASTWRASSVPRIDRRGDRRARRRLPRAAAPIRRILLSAVAIAFIASAETLLSAAAVDRMHDGVRTDYNKELRAQGIGNLLCGVAGALPMTGVIVRSSANVQAGATTRAVDDPARRLDPRLRRAAAVAAARDPDGGARRRAGGDRRAPGQPQACPPPVRALRPAARADLGGDLRAGGGDRPADRRAGRPRLSLLELVPHVRRLRPQGRYRRTATSAASPARRRGDVPQRAQAQQDARRIARRASR